MKLIKVYRSDDIADKWHYLMEYDLSFFNNNMSNQQIQVNEISSSSDPATSYGNESPTPYDGPPVVTLANDVSSTTFDLDAFLLEMANEVNSTPLNLNAFKLEMEENARRIDLLF